MFNWLLSAKKKDKRGKKVGIWTSNSKSSHRLSNFQVVGSIQFNLSSGCTLQIGCLFHFFFLFFFFQQKRKQITQLIPYTICLCYHFKTVWLLISRKNGLVAWTFEHQCKWMRRNSNKTFSCKKILEVKKSTTFQFMEIQLLEKNHIKIFHRFKMNCFTFVQIFWVFHYHSHCFIIGSI